VEQTAQRIFDFMVARAGDDLEQLQVGRDAILKGFKDAEQLFGGTLPEISYQRPWIRSWRWSMRRFGRAAGRLSM
jgi:hypothetical protein